MARQYDVEGTKSFLYWSIGLLVLGIWAVRDGWFTTEAKIAAKTAEELISFKLFNKTLAIISLVAASICGYIHKVVK